MNLQSKRVFADVAAFFCFLRTQSESEEHKIRHRQIPLNANIVQAAADCLFHQKCVSITTGALTIAQKLTQAHTAVNASHETCAPLPELHVMRPLMDERKFLAYF